MFICDKVSSSKLFMFSVQVELEFAYFLHCHQWGAGDLFSVGVNVTFSLLYFFPL